MSPRQCAALLRSGTVNPFRRATFGNLNRLAHKAIVGLITPSVYTARSGRLPTVRGGWVRFYVPTHVAVKLRHGWGTRSFLGGRRTATVGARAGLVFRGGGLRRGRG